MGRNNNRPHYVIIGAGIAGVTAALTIRKRDSRGRVTIISSEHDLPYRRYALPGFISGATPESRLLIHEAGFYSAKKLDLRIAQEVEKIDFEDRRIFFSHKEKLRYDRLLIASGSRPHIPVHLEPACESIHTLRTLDDARTLREKIAGAQDVFVIGGSLASLELLNSLLSRKIGVSFLLKRESFWPLSLSDPDFEEIVRRLRRKPSLTLIAGDDIDSIRRTGDLLMIGTRKGRKVTSRLIMGSYGYSPEVSFLNAREIEIDRGILVDEHLRTSVENVWAAGDCAQLYHRGMNNYYLNFGWPNAKSQGRIAGLNMTGKPTAYDTLKVNPYDIEGIEVGTPWWKRF